MRTPTLAVLLLIALLGVGFGPGCAGRDRVEPRPSALPTGVPADFTLSATVYGPPRSAETEGLPRSLRPARYLIEADGLLRAEAGPGLTHESFPPATRTLDRQEVQRIWRLLTVTGCMDPASPAALTSESAYRPRTDRFVAVVGYSFEGRSGAFRMFLDRAGADALAVERLIDHLADLAWVDG